MSRVIDDEMQDMSLFADEDLDGALPPGTVEDDATDRMGEASTGMGVGERWREEAVAINGYVKIRHQVERIGLCPKLEPIDGDAKSSQSVNINAERRIVAIQQVMEHEAVHDDGVIQLGRARDDFMSVTSGIDAIEERIDGLPKRVE